MGCVSSKHIIKEIKQENLHKKNLDYPNHVVSLTSSTYGFLNLDKSKQFFQDSEPSKRSLDKGSLIEATTKKLPSPSKEKDEPSEIINTWELMEGLEEEQVVNVNVNVVSQSKKNRLFIDHRSPLKFLNPMMSGSSSSPKKGTRKIGGKENKARSLESTPKKVSSNLKEITSSSTVKKASPRLWASIRGSPNVKRCDSLRINDSGVILSRRRRSLGPLFDPELVASFEKEVSEEEEEIKKMVSGNGSVSSSPVLQTMRSYSKEGSAILEAYTKKCPPGGENAVMIYTTTLRSIRKTFEDCNVARSIIESQNVQMFERDISMHSGFKEELRGLMGNNVRVPVVFVKGRLIGGADEMVKLDEEGKLGILFDGIPKAGVGCGLCAGIRFVMCRECNGSCKLLGWDGKRSLKCGECNENGLIQCPICC